MTLLTDPVICWMVAGLAFLLACFPVLYIVEALGRDVLDSLPDHDEGTTIRLAIERADEPTYPIEQVRAEISSWPVRQSPSDLPPRSTPDGHHRIVWVERVVDEEFEAMVRAVRWPSDELFWIRAVERMAA